MIRADPTFTRSLPIPHQSLGWLALLVFSVLLVLAAGAMPAHADVQITKGPTPIPGGNAQADNDLTLRNAQLAVTVAVGTAPPYGVPPGSIVDAAPVVNGDIAGAGDTLTQVDLIPNDWSAWPNTYQRINIVENTGNRGAIKVERDFGEVAMVTTYSLEKGSDDVHMVTQLTNNGSKALDLLSGYVLWERSGTLFGIPGLVADPQSDISVPARGPNDNATANWNALYGEDWAFSVHLAPSDFDFYDYSGRDLYKKYTLQPGATEEVEGWFQIVPSGDLSRMVADEAERQNTDLGTISGNVTTTNGDDVKEPVVVAYRDERPYAWTIGRKDGTYELSLPPADYTLYATAKGNSPSPDAMVTLSSTTDNTRDFTGLGKPSEMQFTVTDSDGTPIDARIDIAKGQTPLVGFLGKSSFFTKADKGKIGIAKFDIAPGDYHFSVQSGSGFLSTPKMTDTVTLAPDSQKSRNVQVEMKARPEDKGWYSADLHQHSLAAEGVSPPNYVFRAQMAAGLDLSFISDHDSLKDLDEASRLAQQREIPFIPSIEISPSWGHFNAMPVKDKNGPLPVNSGTANVDEIFKAARQAGASVIQTNHTTNPYGYLNNLEMGKAPGGFNPGFDLIELNAGGTENNWKKVQEYWNKYLNGEVEKIYRLGAGSDNHDVWNGGSGSIRLYAHVPDALSVKSFLMAAKNGHAYATKGPLIYPQSAQGKSEKTLFGKKYAVDSSSSDGTFRFSVDLQAVDGLKQVELIRAGEIVETRDLSDTQAKGIEFFPTVSGETWFALKVQDADEDKAYTNAIWVTANDNNNGEDHDDDDDGLFGGGSSGIVTLLFLAFVGLLRAVPRRS